MTSPELPKEGCQKCALNQFPHTHKEPPVSLEWEAEFDEKFGFYWGGVEDVLPSERGLKNFIRTHLKEAEERGRKEAVAYIEERMAEKIKLKATTPKKCLKDELVINTGHVEAVLEAAKSPKE